MPTSAAPAVQEVPDGLSRPYTVTGSRVFTTLTNDHHLALARAVKAYRAGCRSRWAPVVLMLMAPVVEGRMSDLHPVRPAISADDIRQQLLQEVLEAALSMPLPKDPLVLQRAILLRATQAVRRRLTRELCRQGKQEPPVEEDDEELEEEL
ncbi:MAG: hypothetical protein JF888_00570 [Candidatus Dormibacteraeota bacterium]|uniref:Uncharacterized protein n=1 Tax=Candidatus Dormiibacter inghamiae TaxID=3127013 RepID=A0A934NAQ3_9BACT|nr:hypothetical protein [Candidatus Dormibacteraeota bacterium]MBJ7607754.1 hypothetical protein [Candidatus Dormibacteraeota bacterium]